jgi:hypothetical protein
MKWTDQGNHIWTSLVEVHSYNFGAHKPSQKKIAFRVDGREQPCRVDFKTMAGTPWEAIDEGAGFGTVALGKKYADNYRKAINEQLTLHPRNVERPTPKPLGGRRVSGRPRGRLA